VHRTPSLALCITLVSTLSAVAPAHTQQPGWIPSHQKISDTEGGCTGTLEDLERDGAGDLAVGTLARENGPDA